MGKEAAEFLSCHQALRSEFLDALKKSGIPSIDAFMAAPENANEFGQLGKLVLAKILLDQEQSAFLQTGDWLGEIIDNQLVEPEDDPIERVEKFVDKVGIITFNYDRTIEHFLWQRMVYGQRRELSEAWDILQRLSVSHVYGHLGAYRPSEKRPETDSQGVGFGDVTKAKIAAKSIELIGERGNTGNTTDNDAARTRQSLLSTAKRIAFLGFGFDEANLRILGLDKTWYDSRPLRDQRFPKPEFSGSSGYGMTDLQCRRTYFGDRNKGNFVWGTESETCLDFVQRYEVVEHVDWVEKK